MTVLLDVRTRGPACLRPGSHGTPLTARAGGRVHGGYNCNLPRRHTGPESHQVDRFSGPIWRSLR
ncbi:hypothetical protein YT1_4468 [Rhodococcus ruber]|nr:hypothetical protein YT1_4468 [Rhodococcus ruber]